MRTRIALLSAKRRFPPGLSASVAAGIGIAASIVGAAAVLSGQFAAPSPASGPVTVARAPAELANPVRHITEKGQKRVLTLPDGRVSRSIPIR